MCRKGSLCFGFVFALRSLRLHRPCTWQPVFTAATHLLGCKFLPCTVLIILHWWNIYFKGRLFNPTKQVDIRLFCLFYVQTTVCSVSQPLQTQSFTLPTTLILFYFLPDFLVRVRKSGSPEVHLCELCVYSSVPSVFLDFHTHTHTLPDFSDFRTSGLFITPACGQSYPAPPSSARKSSS